MRLMLHTGIPVDVLLRQEPRVLETAFVELAAMEREARKRRQDDGG